MPARLVLSAHLDDAVFSCWRVIERGSAERVTVATVFAGCPRPGLEPPPWDEACGVADPARHMLRRREEDAAALRGAGATPVHLEFLDEQYRQGPPPKAAIVEAIEELCQGHDEVWIPAGIGGNADHLVVAEAAVAAASDIRRFLYADLPYTAAHGWPPLVRAARADRHDDCSLETQLNASAFIPPTAVPCLHLLTPAEQQAKSEAIALYRSQLRPLVAAYGRWFEDPDVAGSELYWELRCSARRRPVWQLLERALPASGKLGGEPDGHGQETPFLTVLTRTRATGARR